MRCLRRSQYVKLPLLVTRGALLEPNTGNLPLTMAGAEIAGSMAKVASPAR
jgi:hypothetical protein